ncbi:sensor histidine kinase [Actinoplanes nipponensis]|uniref:histidine kinase n=1 Tax=Actinoplanes nipponensis TaxID=135950 RepID=A0A919MNK7_9ACTN|nr:HAMP domain-containing sensor histidine kinase [Actinoplanes nipponensis]GIE51681.1 hypothetical protein Ani05nite_52150 [Actinoplanes nipponensis]
MSDGEHGGSRESGSTGDRPALREVADLLLLTAAACETPTAALRLAASRSGRQVTDRLTDLLGTLVRARFSGTPASRLGAAGLTAVIQHEVRTPLTAIQGYAELLADTAGPLPERQLDAIRRNARRLTRTVDHLLCSIGGPAGTVARRRAVDLTALTAACVGRRRERDAMIVQFPPAPVRVHAVHRELACAVDNLIDNAVTHTAPHTPITVTLTTDVTLSVRDAGPGIPLAERRHLATAFYRGPEARAQERPGLGLGLMLADRIATAHGGRLRLDTAPERGTVATLHLPPAGN